MNIILEADSYKYSQFPQYPVGTEGVYSYVESRGGKWDQTVMFGLQIFLKEYLAKPITMQDIDEAEEIILTHGEPFNREGWEHILNEHGGRLPVEIKAVPEGTIVPTLNVLATIENTDPKCYWLTSFLETALLRAIWYGTTVATNSFESKKIIWDYLVKSGTADAETIAFKLHDFGMRGVSSRESAGIGDAAHLVNFMGTDTITGLLYARKYYCEEMAGFSIPAMEHSTVTSWGKEHEADSFRNMLNSYKMNGGTVGQSPLIACVSDSFDIYNACSNIWGKQLKQEVLDSGSIVVIRPDSGDPASVVSECLSLLGKEFGYTINDKGFRLLNNVRVIQGDGITNESINHILFNAVDLHRWSADNIAFGQGGALLQGVDRDTLKFAMKCSAIKINGKWEDVYKDPITDTGKRSKRGRLTLLADDDLGFKTVREDWTTVHDEMHVVFRNGKLMNETTFDKVRERAHAPFVNEVAIEQAA